MATADGRVVALDCFKCPVVSRTNYAKVVQMAREGRVASSNDYFAQKE